jgi:DUF1365 family protein
MAFARSQPVLQSGLYEGVVSHCRHRPARHAFHYRVFALLLDLDELALLDERLALFGWNRRALFGFHDHDHGNGSELRLWLDGLLRDAGITADGPRRVLCYPRVMGYVFNPLSVWFCHASDDALKAIIYEVHNTYGERHAYVLPVAPSNGRVEQRVEKDFFVSPFLSMDCAYSFRILPPDANVTIAIRESEAGETVLDASFAGARKPLSDGALLRAFLRYPLMTLKVVTAIHFEALRLMRKGVARHPHSVAVRA